MGCQQAAQIGRSVAVDFDRQYACHGWRDSCCQRPVTRPDLHEEIIRQRGDQSDDAVQNSCISKEMLAEASFGSDFHLTLTTPGSVHILSGRLLGFRLRIDEAIITWRKENEWKGC